MSNPIKLICMLLFASLAFFSCKNKDDTKIKSDTKLETTSSSSSDCPKYDRSDYSHWIDADGDCQDTRVEVLVAENIGTISYLTDSSCKVVTGSWYDPFTDTTFSTASRLDVDHMVPLKEAHESGAYLWSSSKKKEFANELSPSETLIAVSGSANRSKGSRDPAEWLPTNTSYHTTYATNWASIKVKWELTADAEEIATLKSLLGSSATLPIQADETLCTGSVDESVTDNASCCKWCSSGKACGDTCISKSYTCTKSKGCACDR
jgi:hypothetical protein